MTPGEYLINDGFIVLNSMRPAITLIIQNSGDRPIQVGSHYHFFEVNRALHFDRALAYGLRLDIAAGTAVRFEPGEEKEIRLIEFGGTRHIYGHNGLVGGALDDPVIRERAMNNLRRQGFITITEQDQP